MHIKEHSGDYGNDTADALANVGARMPAVESYVFCTLLNIEQLAECGIIPLPLAKVTSDVPELSTIVQPESVATADGTLLPHRNQDTLQAIQAHNLKLLVNTKSEALFWVAFRDMVNTKSPPPAVDISSLTVSFCCRMNPLAPLPQSFNLVKMATCDLLAASIPCVTVDNTPGQFFSHTFTLEEIEWAKDHISKHRENSATGMNRISYSEIIELDNELILSLINLCLDSNNTPSIWLSTTLTGVLKHGKLALDPESYRTIGLESCLLEFMTLLIHARLTAWACAYNIIPPSQNSFREGYCMNNNVFILRSAIDRAWALGKTLFVATVDISNAFPSM